jgi:hypothetical protein
MALGRHVAPHRLVDADAGRLSARELARVERHVAGCRRCAGARGSLARARDAMADIAAQPAPELGWDHIGVRVYWSTSSARHKALRRRQRAWWRRRPAFALAGTVSLAAATGFALTMWMAGRDTDAPSRQAVTRPVDRSTAPSPAAAAVPVLRGVVTFASGAVGVNGAAPRPLAGDADIEALFAGAVVQGARLRTGEGRLVVQFGETSAFALTPRSSVVVGRFDDRAIELAVEEGAIEVDVSHRRADQSFAVVAGRHRVSVVGTAFQVAHRAGDLDVECARGTVSVSDGAGDVSLSAGQELEVPGRSLLDPALLREIGRTRLLALERGLILPLLPVWMSSPAVFETSSVLEVTAPEGRGVRVDGTEGLSGSFAMRVMPGRHHVQVADATGSFRHGSWIETKARERQRASADQDGVVHVAHVSLHGAAGAGVAPGPDPAAAAAARSARRLRRGQLERALAGSARARECLSSLAKRDLADGSTVLFDIGVNDDGTKGHVNVVRSNVPADVEACLRAAVDQVELPRGPAATVRLRLAF